MRLPWLVFPSFWLYPSFVSSEPLTCLLLFLVLLPHGFCPLLVILEQLWWLCSTFLDRGIFCVGFLKVLGEFVLYRYFFSWVWLPFTCLEGLFILPLLELLLFSGFSLPFVCSF